MSLFANTRYTVSCCLQRHELSIIAVNYCREKNSVKKTNVRNRLNDAGWTVARKLPRTFHYVAGCSCRDDAIVNKTLQLT